MWGLIPEAQHLRANKRSIEELGKIIIISHPLILTQMLIAYHMVKAALGHHAIYKLENKIETGQLLYKLFIAN